MGDQYFSPFNSFGFFESSNPVVYITFKFPPLLGLVQRSYYKVKQVIERRLARHEVGLSGYTRDSGKRQFIENWLCPCSMQITMQGEDRIIGVSDYNSGSSVIRRGHRVRLVGI